MFQKFYTDSLLGRFIKRLLRTTPLPLLNIILDGEYIVDGCYYLYQNLIIKATSSGTFCIDPNIHLLPGVKVHFDINSDNLATYTVVKYYNPDDRQQTYNFHSKFPYYDPETHYHLGEYLRYLRNTKNLDLLPYYNCYSGKSIPNVSLGTFLNTENKRVLILETDTPNLTLEDTSQGFYNGFIEIISITKDDNNNYIAKLVEENIGTYTLPLNLTEQTQGVLETATKQIPVIISPKIQDGTNYFNCFLVNDKGPEVVTNPTTKLLAVPVKYGKTYTIAFDTPSPFIIQPILYQDDCGLVIKKYLASGPEYYCDHEFLTDCQTSWPNCNFLNPITFTMPHPIDADYYAQERNLYLAIQVSNDYQGGLVVLEGCHTASWKNTVQNMNSKDREWNESENPLFTKNLTLLHFNSKSSIAFSSRLVEYLLLQVIHSNETLDGNISYVQSLLQPYSEIIDGNSASPNPLFKDWEVKGVWEPKLRKAIDRYTSYKQLEKTIRDIDGYINVDIEKSLLEDR